MWKVFWCGIAVSGLFLAVGVWAASTSTFLYRHPRARDIRIVLDKRTGSPVVEAVVYPTKPALLNSKEPEPRVLISETKFDFGTMDPLADGRHEFELRNVGLGVLKLKVGASTCKCTVGGVSKNEVQPGETAHVSLQWNTGKKQSLFEQSAQILTNDPLRKEINLVVTGKVRMLIGLDRSTIRLPAVEPGSPLRFEVLVYSQMWEDFAIEDLESPVAGLEWQAEDVEPASVPGLEAKAVQRLTVTMPCPAVQGAFQEMLRLQVRSNQTDASLHSVDLQVESSVLRRLSIYGPGIDSEGVIDLGTVPQGAGKKLKLLVKVRDEQRDLGQPKIEISPDFLQARLSPHPGGEDTGLYDLHIELSRGTPACQYLSSPIGRLAIVTDHPRIGTVELKVSFAVLGRE